MRAVLGNRFFFEGSDNEVIEFLQIREKADH
jgi:hypothetical protein